MAAQSPILVQPIPPLVINEGASLHSFDLKKYIHSPNEESGQVRFSAELVDGASLPRGLICLAEGIISGIPANETTGVYQVVVIAENDSPIPFTTEFSLTIKHRIALETQELSKLKSQVWEALSKDLPLPDIDNLLNRAISPVEIYYLLQRFATLTVWDVYSLEAPGEKVPLQLPNASPHYHVYDRGACLVAAPKDLFSHERTLEDALQTARAIATEAFKRDWVIELSGFHKLVRAAWIELQHLSNKYDRKVEILHYNPTSEDIKLYVREAQSISRISL